MKTMQKNNTIQEAILDGVEVAVTVAHGLVSVDITAIEVEVLRTLDQAGALLTRGLRCEGVFIEEPFRSALAKRGILREAEYWEEVKVIPVLSVRDDGNVTVDTSAIAFDWLAQSDNEAWLSAKADAVREAAKPIREAHALANRMEGTLEATRTIPRGISKAARARRQRIKAARNAIARYVGESPCGLTFDTDQIGDAARLVEACEKATAAL